jgi:hypothetical protein
VAAVAFSGQVWIECDITAVSHRTTTPFLLTIMAEQAGEVLIPRISRSTAERMKLGSTCCPARQLDLISQSVLNIQLPCLMLISF